jgi:sigma-B regulation protein RsbU (phosphoserine phosphatase)
MPKLTIRNGPRTGTDFVFHKSVVIGRGPLADLSLEDPILSRRHAMLSWADSECFVSDLGSENGTFVNNKRIVAPKLLKDGDLLNVGTVIAEYSQEGVDGGASTDEPEVHWVNEENATRQVLLTMDAAPAAEQLQDDVDRNTLTAVSQRFRFLNDLGTVVSQTFDETKLLSFVLDQLFALIPQAERAFITLWNDESGELVPKIARTRSGQFTEIAASRTLLNDAIQKREGILVNDIQGDERYATVETIKRIQVLSVICVPMLFHEEIYGVIQVDTTQRGQPFGKVDLTLMLGIASQIGMWLANAKLHGRLVERELLERDLMLARRIQQHFLPRETPEIAPYRVCVDYSPALAVGGDFYDFLHLSSDRIGILVGDVSGKGVSAALWVAKASSDIRYLSVGFEQPAPILERVNRTLSSDTSEGMFITLVLTILDTKTGELLVASAGHPLPLLRRHDGTVVAMGRTGDMPLGLSEKASFQQHRYQLGESDMVVLYTDGVTEAENHDKALFGVERLTDVVQRSEPGVDAIMNSVLSAVKNFSGDEQQSDDLTLLCFGRETDKR